MKQEKYRAIAEIISAIISKKGYVDAGGSGRPGTSALPEGLVLRFEEGKIFLYDAKNNRMTLEEMIQYVDRYLA